MKILYLEVLLLNHPKIRTLNEKKGRPEALKLKKVK